MVKDFISMLTDAFAKSEKSNIGKLFIIVDEQITAIKTALERAEEWRDLDKAKGQTLDLLGDNISQLRGRATDEVFRVLIRGKAARNVSDGTVDKIVGALAKTLNCPHDQIHIVSSIEEDEDEPAAIIVKRAPIESLIQVGLSQNQFSQMVQRTVAGGVRVAYVNLSGSFYFSSSQEIETSEVGFSSNGEDGGTLGALFRPDDDYPLPI